LKHLPLFKRLLALVVLSVVVIVCRPTWRRSQGEQMKLQELSSQAIDEDCVHGRLEEAAWVLEFDDE
jgi:hypothetical protein